MKLTKEQFLKQYGYDYGYNGRIEELRKTEFARLQDTVYLDNAGTALHAESQVRNFFNELNSTLFGNPHSQSPCSKHSTQEINAVRELILKYFNTDSKEYSVIFTAGATAALKLVGECIPWSQESEFSYLRESHNSVIGIRQYVIDKGGTFHSLSVEDITQLLSSSLPNCKQNDVENTKTESFELKRSTFSLFAFPAQCNFTGKKYPLTWIDQWRQCHQHSNAHWMILLDAASYVSTAALDLSKYRPDFVAISFYKIFGFPTGVGALIVKNSIATVLQKKYFGGGTVAVSLSSKPYQIFRENLTARFEDGTVDFLNIIALKYGFQMINSLGIDNITRHTHVLLHYLYSRLSSLRHYNGRNVCVIYGKPQCEDPTQQGPILSFNLMTSQSEFIGYAEVERLASLNNIHLRTGCFCNPGACQYYLGLSDEQIIRNHKEFGHVCWDQHDLIEGLPTGAVRVSIPYCCTFEDIEKFVEFIEENFVEKSPSPQAISCPAPRVDKFILTKIIVYPIKSCEGFEVSQWEIGVDGLRYDREWSLVDPTGSYVNQKRIPQLCLIRPTIDLHHDTLLLNAPNMPTLAIPLNFYPKEELNLRVCGDQCTGLTYGKEINEWFSQFCGRSLTLVRKSFTKSRVVSTTRLQNLHNNSSCSVNHHHNIDTVSNNDSDSFQNGPPPTIAFANESQFLLVSEESVKDLNIRIKQRQTQNKVSEFQSTILQQETTKPISYFNFRPNFVISGGGPYVEDEWDKIRINGQLFSSVGPCNRCTMICIDRDTAKFQKEPLLTLSSYRRDSKGRILFGQLLIHEPHNSVSPFVIKTNSEVEVVEWKNSKKIY